MIHFIKRLPKTLGYMISVIMLVTAAGCAALLPDPDNADQYTEAQLSQFQDKFMDVAGAVKENPDYQRIPLDKREDQSWFLALCIDYWAGKIDKSEFIAKGVERFPGYETSFGFVADEFKK
ncbi:hypothetical protein [Shewanella sp. Isolate11]|uniref:hypothetical protein n=1 Tax=Shewanella sp. Isolate11 TaxID=2908530 RepID=UPI001EFC3174|nr:hypothetical protein [Shewanella sp. Isolate11]MCG9697202.1 hypothetical protein [Shewanella sp. Isolate11]